ncbi:MAG: hypothetical protein LBR38_08865 [Synergistaceae bacterium]|jgi:site-specific DNA-methyltransferase (adenine-specific)|nr:hypothetical protein [Synergistaceae bacterium]
MSAPVYELHQACVTLPKMDAEEFTALRASIRERGFDPLHPVILFEGQVLDGRHRYEAAVAEGVTPVFVDAPEGIDPYGFVKREHEARRSWPNQEAKAIVLGRLLQASTEWAAEAEARKAAANAARAEAAKAQERREDGTFNTKPVVEQIVPLPDEVHVHRGREVKAEQLGCNRGAVQRAEFIERHSQELADRVVAGEITPAIALKEIRKAKRAQARIENAKDAEVENFHLGNWRDHIPTLPDGSVRLLLTDPPYGIDYQSNYRQERHAPIENDGQTDAMRELEECIAACLPKLAGDAHVLVFCHWRREPEVRSRLEAAGLAVKGLLVWEKNNTSMGDLRGTFAPKHELIVHAVKGTPELYVRKPDVLHADRVPTDDHPTEKPAALLRELIEATTVAGDTVLDPFAGVASTLVAAKDMERGYFGCEISPEYHATGRGRLA